ncbi:MAG TPA: glucose-6-phosphate isomerase [Dongiaceae bacterium]|jgi:glucose-6-phosphate isomerase|nr:glucose-6-phosphate isomerase [Dongiaceae bacterium]
MTVVGDPVRLEIRVGDGSMECATGRYEKRLSELVGLYSDSSAYSQAVKELGDPVVYAVEDFRPSSRAGDLIFGVTRMRPGKIGREFYLTRGHIHAKADRPEIYHGQAGRGLMLMESPAGETCAIEIAANSVCYVPPYWIHRSVNIGAGDLVMAFAYPADAGQDYGIISRSNGMRKRVMDDGNGGWVLVDNADYRPRPAAEVEALLQD